MELKLKINRHNAAKVLFEHVTKQAGIVSSGGGTVTIDSNSFDDCVEITVREPKMCNVPHEKVHKRK
jgi:hypothetical protein